MRPPAPSVPLTTDDVSELDQRLRAAFFKAQGVVAKKEVPKVLLILDNLWETLIFSLRLRRLGAVCHAVRRGRDAFRHWEHQRTSAVPFDLVVIDREMDWIGGIEFIRMVAAHHQKYKARPICVIAVCKGKDDPRTVLDEGFGFMMKRPVGMHFNTFTQLLLPEHMRVRNRFGILCRQPAYQRIRSVFETVEASDIQQQLLLSTNDPEYANAMDSMIKELNRRISDLETALSVARKGNGGDEALNDILAENQKLRNENMVMSLSKGRTKVLYKEKRSLDYDADRSPEEWKNLLFSIEAENNMLKHDIEFLTTRIYGEMNEKTSGIDLQSFLRERRTEMRKVVYRPQINVRAGPRRLVHRLTWHQYALSQMEQGCMQLEDHPAETAAVNGKSNKLRRYGDTYWQGARENSKVAAVEHELETFIVSLASRTDQTALQGLTRPVKQFFLQFDVLLQKLSSTLISAIAKTSDKFQTTFYSTLARFVTKFEQNELTCLSLLRDGALGYAAGPQKRPHHRSSNTESQQAQPAKPTQVSESPSAAEKAAADRERLQKVEGDLKNLTHQKEALLSERRTNLAKNEQMLEEYTRLEKDVLERDKRLAAMINLQEDIIHSVSQNKDRDVKRLLRKAREMAAYNSEVIKHRKFSSSLEGVVLVDKQQQDDTDLFLLEPSDGQHEGDCSVNRERLRTAEVRDSSMLTEPFNVELKEYEWADIKCVEGTVDVGVGCNFSPFGDLDDDGDDLPLLSLPGSRGSFGFRREGTPRSMRMSPRRTITGEGKIVAVNSDGKIVAAHPEGKFVAPDLSSEGKMLSVNSPAATQNDAFLSSPAEVLNDVITAAVAGKPEHIRRAMSQCLGLNKGETILGALSARGAHEKADPPFSELYVGRMQALVEGLFGNSFTQALASEDLNYKEERQRLLASFALVQDTKKRRLLPLSKKDFGATTLGRSLSPAMSNFSSLMSGIAHGIATNSAFNAGNQGPLSGTGFPLGLASNSAAGVNTSPAFNAIHFAARTRTRFNFKQRSRSPVRDMASAVEKPDFLLLASAGGRGQTNLNGTANNAQPLSAGGRGQANLNGTANNAQPLTAGGRGQTMLNSAVNNNPAGGRGQTMLSSAIGNSTQPITAGGRGQTMLSSAIGNSTQPITAGGRGQTMLSSAIGNSTQPITAGGRGQTMLSSAVGNSTQPITAGVSTQANTAGGRGQALSGVSNAQSTNVAWSRAQAVFNNANSVQPSTWGRAQANMNTNANLQLGSAGNPMAAMRLPDFEAKGSSKPSPSPFYKQPPPPANKHPSPPRVHKQAPAPRPVPFMPVGHDAVPKPSFLPAGIAPAAPATPLPPSAPAPLAPSTPAPPNTTLQHSTSQKSLTDRVAFTLSPRHEGLFNLPQKHASCARHTAQLDPSGELIPPDQPQTSKLGDTAASRSQSFIGGGPMPAAEHHEKAVGTPLKQAAQEGPAGAAPGKAAQEAKDDDIADELTLTEGVETPPFSAKPAAQLGQLKPEETFARISSFFTSTQGSALPSFASQANLPSIVPVHAPNPPVPRQQLSFTNTLPLIPSGHQPQRAPSIAGQTASPVSFNANSGTSFFTARTPGSMPTGIPSSGGFSAGLAGVPTGFITTNTSANNKPRLPPGNFGTSGFPTGFPTGMTTNTSANNKPRLSIGMPSESLANVGASGISTGFPPSMPTNTAANNKPRLSTGFPPGGLANVGTSGVPTGFSLGMPTNISASNKPRLSIGMQPDNLAYVSPAGVSTGLPPGMPTNTSANNKPRLSIGMPPGGLAHVGASGVPTGSPLGMPANMSANNKPRLSIAPGGLAIAGISDAPSGLSSETPANTKGVLGVPSGISFKSTNPFVNIGGVAPPTPADLLYKAALQLPKGGLLNHLST